MNNVLAILKDFTFWCKSVFENTTTKMSKTIRRSFQKQAD